MRETKVLVKKAPYRVPTMAEVRARKKNGLKVISTFSGGGGSCLGFEMAGGIAGAGSDQVLMEGDGENLGTVHRRKFTISELKANCSFPQDFVLTGTYAQQWERLGQSVPPVMMRHQAEALLTSGVFEEN